MKSFYSLEEFSFLDIFQTNIKTIISEYKDIDNITSLKKYFYTQNEQNIAVFGELSNENVEWKSLPIFCGLNKNVEEVSSKIFPNTLKFIYSLESKIKINAAQFCKLNGTSYFPRHKHDKKNHVIFHNILYDLDHICLYESNNEYKEVKNCGDYVIFPLTNMHSVYNFAKKPKISFSISFKI